MEVESILLARQERCTQECKASNGADPEMCMYCPIGEARISQSDINAHNGYLEAERGEYEPV